MNAQSDAFAGDAGGKPSRQEQSFLSASTGGEFPAGQPSPSHPPVCLVGGMSIVYQGIRLLLESLGVPVVEQYAGEQGLAEALRKTPDRKAQEAVLILTGEGPFQAFHNIRHLLGGLGEYLPLVVVCDKLSRGHVYTALRSGARAYVTLDAAPEELTRAIDMAAHDKVYLSSEAAELVASDISTAGRPGPDGKLPTVELSPREVEIVQLLCEGHISREVARHLHISSKTVGNHRYNIYKKCGVDNIAGLIRHAIHRGLVSV